jgi:hypothetical protein
MCSLVLEFNTSFEERTDIKRQQMAIAPEINYSSAWEQYGKPGTICIFFHSLVAVNVPQGYTEEQARILTNIQGQI